MRKTALAVCAAAAGLLPGARPATASSGQTPGVSAGQILEIPMGSRPMGMGSAFTGLADDVSALWYNPAGLSTLDSREATFMSLKGLEDQTLQYLAIATPLQPFTGFGGQGYSALGASLLFSNQGQIHYNQADSLGNITQSQTLTAGSDFVATVGYSEQFLPLQIDTPRGPYEMNHFVGAGVKLIRSTLVEAYRASAVAVDAGYLGRIREMGLSWGLSALNLGSELRYTTGGQHDRLPLTGRLGLAYTPRELSELGPLPGQRVTFAGDAEYLVYERLPRGYVGVEYTVFGQQSLRLGYQLNSDVGALTFGFGAGYGPFRFDFAWAQSTTFTDSFRFNLTYRFGHVPLRRREERHRPDIQDMPGRDEIKKGIDSAVPQTYDTPTPPRRAPVQNRPTAPGWIY